jgi:hypothetical protein
MLLCMAARDPIQVILEIEPKTDPIAGTALGPGGTTRSFCGWTSLADAVAAAIDGDEHGATDRG